MRELDVLERCLRIKGFGTCAVEARREAYETD
jgi:hypothetical protein